MKRNQQQTLFVAIVALFVLTLGMSKSALAQGGRGGVGPRGFSGGVLHQLVFPCQTECRETARDCSESLESEAVTSIQEACASQVTAAKTACASDPSTSACRDAISALRTCGESSLTTLQTGVESCRDTEASCREACTSGQ